VIVPEEARHKARALRPEGRFAAGSRRLEDSPDGR